MDEMMMRKCSSHFCDSNCSRLLFHVLVVVLMFWGECTVKAQDYGGTDTKELEALFEVLSSINSETNWRSELPDPCNSWQQGIFCLPDEETGNLHVTNLEFGTLSQYIDIIPCSIDASLHPSVGRLPYLQSLQIFNCFTSTPAIIPKELGTLRELQILTLQDNPGLVGTLPVELGNLTNLQRLSVSQSGVGGSIPAEIGNLITLLQLDLSRNRLEGTIPASLNSLVNLQIMDLGDNLLSGALPPLNGLGRLVKIVLSENLLNGSIPSGLGQLSSLTYLDVSRNNFTGGIPASFANLKSLEDLFVGHNNMGTSLPGFLGSMPALSRLSLAESSYLGEIPHEFGDMTNLRVLVLTGNSLSGTIPSELGSLPHIYQMDLSMNNLSGPVPFSLEFVERMGTNLIFLNNTGLCFPHSSSRVAVSTMGLDTCIIEGSGPASYDTRVEGPSVEPEAPIHNSVAPARKILFPLSALVAVCVVINFGM